MRNPNRIPIIIKKLEEAWKRVPDWRLGQLISNLRGPGVQDVFYLEDDELEKRLDEFLDNKKAGIFFFLASFLIGLARVFSGIHWPSDILVGALVGILSAYLLRKSDFLLTRILKKLAFLNNFL